MKLVCLDGIYFNVDRIDAITLPYVQARLVKDNDTKIYVGGSDNPWCVNLPIEEVVKIISEQGDTDGKA